MRRLLGADHPACKCCRQCQDSQYGQMTPHPAPSRLNDAP